MTCTKLLVANVSHIVGREQQGDKRRSGGAGWSECILVRKVQIWRGLEQSRVNE